MTREKAIRLLTTKRAQPSTDYQMAEVYTMAIQALSQEPTEKPMCDRNICISNEYNGIGCDECVVNKEQEPCEDVVSRQAVFDLVRSLTRWCVRSEDGKFNNVGLLYDDVMFGIDKLPSVTHKSGKWIGVTPMVDTLMCSECGENIISADFKSNYCPYCGAAMFEPQESEDK